MKPVSTYAGSVLELNYPPDLPIVRSRDAIVSAIKEHQVVIITGDTGSGKSTQIPKMCIEAGRGTKGLIGCTQPRRIAAIALAHRLKEELGDRYRYLVDYKVRFQDKTTQNTRIKYMTDGILLAESRKDRLFKAYDTLIIDEAHERTLNIDFLLGMLRRVLPRRPGLKLIVTSATMDPERFSSAFGGAPIIEVSGKTYPVEVWYRPLEALGDRGEVTHIDGAIEAFLELRRKGLRGSVLIFMPTESDIRETVIRLEELALPDTIVLPLFGRLATADQQRIFRPTHKDKVVVATNVAETSITIPGIKYVIDSGLARISQYNPRSRTQGLPVVPISRASAEQRKGRCGRVSNGICIRLYSEEDFLSRSLYTPPEIQRSNLAEVILRMLDLGLGDIESFPFLDPPSPSAIKDGFKVLKELGAVDEHGRLTSMGKKMARFPLDPRLSRMLLQAQKEDALSEISVLCAVLSNQDPRERPLEKENAADQAHSRFLDRRSDFVTLLNIWQAYQMHQKEGGSRNQMRKFCGQNYLSYRKMRDWQDIHDEILGILKEIGDFRLNREPASYESIHRSIVAGYLSHIATKKDRNIYVGAKGRQIMIFPGSALFKRGGEWIVAAELVHTSRLFARTVAIIDPGWLEELGGHLCKYAYLNPHWEKRRGQVVATEQVSLYGLRIPCDRKINYGRIDPEVAREIFIRSALVEGEIGGFNEYQFLEHNRKLLDHIKQMEEKIRRRDLAVDDERIFQFYDERIPTGIFDRRSFDTWLKNEGGDSRLRMSEADLLRTNLDWELLERFPDLIEVSGVRLPVRYRFDPLAEDDGMTVTVPAHLLFQLPDEVFDWMVPGLLREKIIALLKGLPKAVRRRLVPISETVEKVLEGLRFKEGSLFSQLSQLLEDLAGVRVSADEWKKIQEGGDFPPYLLPRLEVVSEDGKVLAAGRNVKELRILSEKLEPDKAWEEARNKWERVGLTGWDFGDLPRSIVLGADTYGIKKLAYPGLVDEGGKVAIRLFANPQKAMEASRDGLLVLYQWAFSRELRHWRKEWDFPPELKDACFFMGDSKEAKRHLHLYILRELFDLQDPVFPDRRRFEDKVESLRGCLGPGSRVLLAEVFEVIRHRHETHRQIQLFKTRLKDNPLAREWMKHIASDLQELVPADFLLKYRREQIQELPRYLKALQIRAQRAYVSMEKDRQKERMVIPYLRRLEELRTRLQEDPSSELRSFYEEFRWNVEEYKISVFAPEVGTRYRISKKILEEKWTRWWKQG